MLIEDCLAFVNVLAVTVRRRVAPFIVRPLPGATVSMPLTWDEVDSSLDPRALTIKTALDRMDRLGSDPMLPVVTESPDLGAVLGKLAEAMKG